jgi:hypothetical protein
VINADERQIVAETVAEQARAAWGVAKNSAEKSRGFDVQIPASKFGFAGLYPLNVGCPSDVALQKCLSTPAPPEMPPSDPFWTKHDACARVTCVKGSSTQAVVETFMTMKPEKDVTKRHPFTYDTTSPAGTAYYDPNPLMTWHVDLTDLNAIHVSADLDVAVKITPTNGSLFDFKHKGTVTAESTNGAPSGVVLDIEFTGLFLAGDLPITAHAELNANNEGSGAVKDGDMVLANVNKTLGLEWLGDCAPAP